jgi:glycosyltransferase involved in cell wall biosynthesis
VRFSIVVPTQDRAELLAVVVRHAMSCDHPSFEIIVSDNSTSEAKRQLNRSAVRDFEHSPNFRIVYPPGVLSAPEHFEFALAHTQGDYVMYLTDKMVALPHLLSDVDDAISATSAEIVNWAYAPYLVESVSDPAGAGVLTQERSFLNAEKNIETYDPIEALRFKASCAVPRNEQSTKDYALGKIVFGCYSKTLINRIRERTGAVFKGATHDYSAMIQALSLAEKCVMLNKYEVIFISLPPDQSLGSLTAKYSEAARKYFDGFVDSESIVQRLLVPGLYASQHNMVAHDYKKYLPLYGHLDLFDAGNWLNAINKDLRAEGRIWSDPQEMQEQLGLLSRYLATNHPLHAIDTDQPSRERSSLRRHLGARFLDAAIRVFGQRKPEPSRSVRFRDLKSAVRHAAANERFVN